MLGTSVYRAKQDDKVDDDDDDDDDEEEEEEEAEPGSKRRHVRTFPYRAADEERHANRVRLVKDCHKVGSEGCPCCEEVSDLACYERMDRTDMLATGI